MLNNQLMRVIAILLSSITICYGVVFAYQLGGGFFLGTLLAIMAISFNLLEFNCSFYTKLYVQQNNLGMAVITTIPIVLGIAFSLFANSWVIANQYSEYQAKLISDSEQYKSWQRKKQVIEEQISEYQILGLSESVIQGNIQNIESQISNIFSQPALNSAGRNSGQSVGGITNNCSNTGSYYYSKYCADIEGLRSRLLSLNGDLKKYNTMQQLNVDLNNMATPPKPTDSQIPAIASINRLTGINSDYLISLINVFFAAFNEFGAILAWYLVSNTVPTRQRMAVVIENDDSDEESRILSGKQAGISQTKQLGKKK